MMRYFQYFVILIIIFSSFAASGLLFFPEIFLSYFDLTTINVESIERIGLAQLAFGFASVFAILLAAFEFHQLQRKPNIDLFLALLNADGKLGGPTKLIKEKLGNRNHVHSIKFGLLTINDGNIPARYLKLSIWTLNNYASFNVTLKQVSDPTVGNWTSNYTDNVSSHVFQGGADLLVFPSKRETESQFNEISELGEFKLIINHKEAKPLGNLTVPIYYSIVAEDAKLTSGEFKFSVE